MQVSVNVSLPAEAFRLAAAFFFGGASARRVSVCGRVSVVPALIARMRNHGQGKSKAHPRRSRHGADLNFRMVFVGTSFMVLLRVERRPTVNMINPYAAMGLIG